MIEAMDHQEKRTPILLTHALFQSPLHPDYHPLRIQRAGPLIKILEILDWLTPSERRTIVPMSRKDQERFHTSDYLDALEAASVGKANLTDVKKRYQLGTRDNPILPTMAERARLLAGGSAMAAELSLKNRVVFSPSGGAHHGMPDRANGFCYTNDPVFAIKTYFDHGLSRIAYVDLDAHHGDGVEEVFLGDKRVLMISIHESGRWPGTGQKDGVNAINRPVAKGFNDTELFRLLDDEILPVLHNFNPDAMVILSGADAMAGDPLMGLSLTNYGLVQAINILLPLAQSAILLGGGGYNPWTTIRYWTMLWATLSGRGIPPSVTPEIKSILKSLDCARIKSHAVNQHWFSSFSDQISDSNH
jgi:acetoin utilization protein AcuC